MSVQEVSVAYLICKYLNKDVRRVKVAFLSVSHSPAAPAGRNRIGHGEVAGCLVLLGQLARCNTHLALHCIGNTSITHYLSTIIGMSTHMMQIFERVHCEEKEW